VSGDRDDAVAGGIAGPASLRPLLTTALDAMVDGAFVRGGPVPAGTSGELAAQVAAALADDPLPVEGVGAGTALAALTGVFTRGSADPSEPACAGHLHCPPLAVAVAADLVASALNQSLDSWDQAPAATALEPLVVRALARLAGLDPDRAGGVVTSGGTASNLMGLLLARDRALRTAFGVDVGETGLPGQAAGRLRVLCSADAHFSLARAAALLGLGERAVLPVATDGAHRMDPTALTMALAETRRRGEVPVAVVATAGTTDFGAIDPLDAIAAVCAEQDVWLHVDAAYGGGALFSSRLAPLLTGLARADSAALDLHKLGWQPVAAGVFLIRDAAFLEPLARQVAYLNPADDEESGYPSLLGRSLRTTRRPDVLKIAVSLRALGRAGLGALVDRCHDLAWHAARGIAAHPRLELDAEPVLTTVVFGYRPRAAGDDVRDRVNAALRRRLLREGRAVVGRTEAGGRVRLKLTLLNPHATEADVDRLLDAVAAAGEKEDL
jgi:L-2,4-diaminobutyrate decarboxylase